MRSTMSFGFPPLTRVVKILLIVYASVFLLMKILSLVSPQLFAFIRIYLSLIPELTVGRFFVWQMVTYSFLHADLWHILFNSLSLYMFGSAIESYFGRRQFTEYFFFCVIGAAITTLVVSYAHFLGMSPEQATVGASGGIFGLLIAFGMLYGEREMMIFPFPIMIKAKYMVIVWIFISLVGALSPGRGVNEFAHLGGLAFGFFYLKFLPKRGLTAGFSEMYYGVHNRYHRWKRKQAAKKFEVYMRKHDPKDYFDEYGNYRDPGKRPDDRDSRGPWVN